MDERAVVRRRRLLFGSAIGGVLLMTVGTSVIFAGMPDVGIAMVAASALLLVGAVVVILR
jgi:hypothetical protein